MSTTDSTLSSREVADFAGASKKLVESAIEDGILHPTLVHRGKGRPDRLLPPHAVALAGVLARLELSLPVAQKRRLAVALNNLPVSELHSAKVELLPALALDVGRLVGDAADRAHRYAADRDRFIERNPNVKGGIPVIRGTRMTVYAVFGRIGHGETIDDLQADNPDIPREALETALVFARTHPLSGRPGGTSWKPRTSDS